MKIVAALVILTLSSASAEALTCVQVKRAIAAIGYEAAVLLAKKYLNKEQIAYARLCLKEKRDAKQS